MCRFVVQIKKAMLNVSDKLFHLTFVVREPVSEALWDWFLQVNKSLFFFVEAMLYSVYSTQVC